MRYGLPKMGVFLIHTDEYSVAKGGWVQKEESRLIIGETAFDYIERFSETEIPYWDEYGKYSAFMTVPIGIHKSRFVRWETFQMILF